MIIAIKIDVTRLDKKRFFKSEKTGAVYADITLLGNRDGADQYGNDFMVVQQVSKEERLAGTKGAILGNGRIISGGPEAAAPTPIDKDDDIPF